MGELEQTTIIDAMIDGVTITDMQGRIININQATTEQSGYEKEEVIGKTPADLLIAERDRPKFFEQVKNLLSGKPIEASDYLGIHKNGTQLPVSINLSLLKDSEGKPNAIVAVSRDIIKRKRMEQRIEHLNAVLRAIRNVSQITAREKDRDKLLKGACDTLIQTRGYYNAWLAILDESGGPVTTAEAGLDKDFLPMVELLKGGELTDCARRALMQSEVVVTEDPSSTCVECPLAGLYRGRGAMTIHLEHRGKAYGVLCVSIPRALVTDEEEQSLVKEIANDIAFALHNIEVEEKRRRMAEALWESEEKYRLVVENANEGISIAQDGMLKFVNDKIVELSGYSEEELLSKNFIEIVHPDDRETAMKSYLNRLESKEVPQVYSIRIIDKEGNTKWIEISSVLITWECRPAILSFATDITERKEAEEALEESEEKLRTFMETASDLMHIADKDGKCTYVNNSMARTLGYSKEEMVGMHITQLLTKEAMEKDFKPNWDKFIANGEISLETTFLTKDGKEVCCEIKAIAVYDSDGNYIGSRAVHRDITERKRAEEALQESEASYRDLADSITDIFFAFDRDLRYTYWNKASEQLTGVSAEDALGKHLYDIFPRDEQTRAAERVYLKALRTKQPQHFGNEYQLGGKDFFFEISAYPTKSGLSVFTKDITERKRMEQELRSSEERLRILFEYAPDAYYLNDSKGIFVDGNKAAEEITGYKKDELIGNNFLKLKLLPPRQIPKAAALLAKNALGQATGPDEFILNRKDGNQVPVEIRTFPVKIEGQALVLGIARDITERKQAEEEMRVKDSAIASSINAIVMADLKGNLTYVNDSFLKIWGYENDNEVLGKQAVQFWQSEDKALEVVKALEEKGGWVGELVAKRKDGSLFDTQVSTSIVVDEIGKPIRRMASFIDITERKEAEELYKTLASSSPVGVYIAQDGKFLLVNPQFQKYMGFSEDELLGTDPLRLVHPEDREQVRKNAVEMLKGNRSSPYEFRAISNDGEIIWIMETVASIHHKGKRATLGNFMDITERKRMEQELQKKNEQLDAQNEELRDTQEQLVRSERLAAIGQLAGGVGHELRNPLGAIKNAVYYVKGKVAKSELVQKEPRVTEFLDIVDDEINSSNKIINDLLGFSRVGKPAVSPARIEKVIDDALSYSTIPENIKLTKKLDADLPEVKIDADQIRQVLVNIIINAVQAMPDGGRLTISAREKDKFLEVQIADTGCGIPQEVMDKIFDPLFTTRAKGIGLGLAVCKAIIDRHQGYIEVESKVEKRTTFTIKLPLEAE